MSFLAPAFLLGLGLLALPVWLHRRQVQSADRRLFSSLWLMRPAAERVHVERRIRYWWLLTLRLALLTAVVFAFAQPLLSRPAAPVKSAPAHYLLVDRSASMARAMASGAVRDAVAQLLKQTPPAGTQTGLLTVGQQLTVAMPAGSENPAIIAAAAALETDFSALAYDQALAMASYFLTDERGRFTPAVVHFISDFQASAMPAQFARLLPPAHVDLRLYPVDNLLNDNWSVSAVTAVKGAGGQLSVQVVPSGAPPPTDLSVSVNGQPVADRWPLNNADALAPVTLPATLLPGENRIRVTLATDALAADNEFFAVLALGGSEPVPLLTAGALDPATIYLVTALDAAGLVQRFEAEAMTTFDPRTLPRQRWLAITDLGALPQSLEAALLRWLADGGRLFGALGSATRDRTQVPLGGQALDWQIKLESEGPLAVSAVQRGHPLLGMAAGWNDLMVTEVAPVRLLGGEDVLVALGDGSPLVWRQQQGQGELLVLASDLGRKGNDLPASPVFVPWISAMAQALSGRAALARQLTVGDPVPFRRAGTAVHQLVGPAGGQLFGLEAKGPVRLSEPGYYELYDQDARMTTVAVNIDQRESDLSPVAEQDFSAWRAALGRPPIGPTQISSSAVAPAQPFHLSLLVALVALMLGECVLANRHIKAAAQ